MAKMVVIEWISEKKELFLKSITIEEIEIFMIKVHLTPKMLFR